MRRDPNRLIICGGLFCGMLLPEDSIQAISEPQIQQNAMIVPVGDGRFRCYLMHRSDARPLLSGRGAVTAFAAGCVASGASEDWFEDVDLVGPLSSFDAADRWVDHPYHNGIALIGDAAATSNPCFGSGLSLALRDVRVVGDCLATTANRALAATAYADEHRSYYDRLRMLHGWAQQLFFGVGPAADGLRSQAMPKLVNDPSRRPDTVGIGPEAPNDEFARRRFLGYCE